MEQCHGILYGSYVAKYDDLIEQFNGDLIEQFDLKPNSGAIVNRGNL